MSKILRNPKLGAAHAMLRAVGLRKSDYNKHIIGIGSVWLEGNPCNVHSVNLVKMLKLVWTIIT